MAAIEAHRQTVVPLDEDSEEKFQQDAEGLAKVYLKLYFDNSTPYISKGINRRTERANASPDDEVLYRYDPAYKPMAESLSAMAGIRLRGIGDQINTAVADERFSAFTIGQSEFTALCRSLLTRSSTILTNGWLQVVTVYQTLARIVEKLRQAVNVPEPALRRREALLSGFVGPAFRELGLESWITDNGGLRQAPSETDSGVDIPESSA